MPKLIVILISRREPYFMSQAHGRYSGSRDKDQRQPRQPSKTTSHRQNKPYIKAPPARDPAETASIFKTRSFKLLVDTVGAENIALGLDSNLTRVAELVNGERFTPETAFHIETTLGLPDGFFDQPNPVLTPEIIARLRSPLDFIHAHVEPEFTYEQVLKPAPVPQVDHHPTLTERLPREPEMPKKTDGGSPRAVAKSNTTASKLATTPPKSAPAKAEASSKSGAQQTLPLNDAAALENIRRANLHVLTSRKGSKVRLGAVMDISDSNMANRFYGQKRMDDAEANRFTERLGLPTGWMDVPRSVTDISESVSDLLVPASRRHASAQQELPPAIEPKATVAKKPAGTKAKTAGARLGLPTDADSTDGPTGLAAETNAAVGQRDQAVPSAAEPAIPQPVDNDVSFSAASQQLAPASVTQVITEPRRLTSATNLDDLLGIEPIAEALLKTLAGKARTGRLDEMKALELLQQAVLI
jgi:hypothetical protein